MLRQHRIDYLRKCLVGGPHAVPSGQQIAFQPSLAAMLAQYLHQATIGAQVVINGNCLRHEAAFGSLENGAQAIRFSLIRAEHTKVLRVQPEYIGKEVSKLSWSFRNHLTRAGNFQRIVGKVR